MGCLKCVILWCSVLFIGILVLLKLFIKLRTRWNTSKTCLVGKTIIVTGATTGIGYEAALEFAKRGARVILACREKTRATQARDKIIRETENENVVFKIVDFSSLKSVREFAKDIVESEERIDVLVNNAGTADSDDKVTEDGLQFLMQVNHFGPFLLTLLLIDKLKKSAPSRIINVSSGLAARAKLNLDNLNTCAGPFYSYNNSKLCNILFTKHLAKLLAKHNVTVFSVHPGVVRTELHRHDRGLKKLLVAIIRPVMKNVEEGAQTIIHTVTRTGIEHHTGDHFDECQVVDTYATARDPDLPKKLWDKSVELLKCDKEVKNL